MDRSRARRRELQRVRVFILGTLKKASAAAFQGYWLGPPLIRASDLFLRTARCARLRVPLRPVPGASEDGAAPNHLTICHRPARPFRRAP